MSDFIDAAVELGISSLGEGSSTSSRAGDANSVQVGGGGAVVIAMAAMILTIRRVWYNLPACVRLSDLL
jgi:hypothetical protein